MLGINRIGTQATGFNVYEIRLLNLFGSHSSQCGRAGGGGGDSKKARQTD